MSTGFRFFAQACSSPRLDAKDTRETQNLFALLRSGILLLDRFLRRRLGIYEFTADPQCLLRVATTCVRTKAKLPQGAKICPSDTLIELHFWNEHLEPLLALRAPCARARLICRRLELSLGLLAAYLVLRPEIEATMIHARVVMPLGERFARFEAIAEMYGFTVTTSTARGMARWHDFFEEFLLRSLRWAFNPAPKDRRPLRFRRADLWMDRDQFVARYLDSYPLESVRDSFVEDIRIPQTS